MRTPWGKSQDKIKIVNGVNFYSTASHGGFKVRKSLNSFIPENLRQENCWYEEDVEFCLPFIFIPRLKNNNPEMYNTAVRTLKNWYPDEYEKFFNVQLKAGESYKRDKDMFDKEHANDWVGICAINIGSGNVKVTFSRGGKRNTPTKTMIIDIDEYRKRSQFGYVVQSY